LIAGCFKPATGGSPALPLFLLFLLFLQEIISERYRLPRRNPGIPAVRPSKEQRACGCKIPVNSQESISWIPRLHMKNPPFAATLGSQHVPK
jgi:hypothetical protein